MIDESEAPDFWYLRYRLNNPVNAEYRADDLHKTVMSLYGPPPADGIARAVDKGILWRLETPHEEEPYLLIQSQEPPTPEARSLPHVRVIPVRGAFARLTEGARVAYRIRQSGRGTRSLPAAGQPRGKKQTFALTPTQAADTWQQRATRAGLDLDHATTSATRIDRKPHRRPQPQPARWVTDQFEGEATITDSAALASAIRTGIGPLKAWGCGLMTVIRIEATHA